MATTGIFCPQCRTFHPSDSLPAPVGQKCPSCGHTLAESALTTVEPGGWYYARAGRLAGPYSLTELQLLAAVGDLRPNDLIWEGEANHPPRAISAKSLLRNGQTGRSRRQPPAAPPAGQPVPPWPAQGPSRSRPLFFVPEATLAAALPAARSPRTRHVPSWVGVLLVAVLVLGLMGLRFLVGPSPEVDAELKKRIASASQPPAAKSEARGDKPPPVPLSRVGKAAEPRLPPPKAGNAFAFAPALLPAPEPPPQANAPLAHVHCTAGWATFGQVLPPGVAGEGLQLGELPTQTDVKTRWPDGSIRFAVVTARVPRAGRYALKHAPAAKDWFSPKTLPYVWAYFAVGPDGKAEYHADTSGKGEAEYWLLGPLACEIRYVADLKAKKGEVHPFLRVVFDLRVYKDGQARADVTVENTLDRRAATVEQYNVALGDVTGKTLFTRNGLTHYYLTRWRHVLPLGLEAARVVPDLEPAYQAHALPRYVPLMPAYVNKAEGEKFEPLATADLSPDMSAHGGRPELAPYPDWTARYLVHKDPRQARYVLANGDLAGSWPIHLRKGDGAFPSIDEHPQLWLDPRAEAASRPLGDLNALGPLIPDVAHQPSLAYVPYLLTGDRYYADEMTFWANFVLLSTFQDAQYNARGGSKGLLAIHEVRGIAWGLRNLTDTAAYLPDQHPLKKYFAEKIKNNLEWLDQYADANPAPLGSLWHDRRPENETMAPRIWIAQWEQNFLAWAIDRANKQGFAGGLKHRDRIARFQLSLFTGGKDYPRQFGAPYVLAVGEKDAAGQVKLYATMRELYDNNFAGTGQKGTEFAGYYGADARLMLMIGMENNWPGAKQAYDYLWPKLAIQPHVDGQTDLALRPGWAIAP